MCDLIYSSNGERAGFIFPSENACCWRIDCIGTLLGTRWRWLSFGLTAAKGGAFIIKCGAAVTRSYFRRQVQVNRWLRASKTCAADLHWFVHFDYILIYSEPVVRGWHIQGEWVTREIWTVCVLFFFFQSNCVTPTFSGVVIDLSPAAHDLSIQFFIRFFCAFCSLYRGRAPCRLSTLIAAQSSIDHNLCKFQVSNHQIIVKMNRSALLLLINMQILI